MTTLLIVAMRVAAIAAVLGMIIARVRALRKKGRYVLWVIGQVLIALLGMAALIIAVVTIWYVVGFLVLSGVSRLFPLTGRRTREKGRKVGER